MERLEIKLTADELKLLNGRNAVLQLHTFIIDAIIGQTETIEIRISLRE